MNNQFPILNLNSFIQNFDMSVDNDNAGYWLHIPGYHPMPWRPPKRRKLLSRVNKNEVFYEAATTAALSFFFQNWNIETFFDVGARKGYFAELALHWQAYDIHVSAFEVQPTYYAILAQKMNDHGLAGRHGQAFLAALSDEHVGQQTIWYSVTKLFEARPDIKDYRDPWYTRLKFALKGIKNRDEPQQAEVEVTSIDHFTRTNNLFPDLIKIDVDGYEAKVLPGSMELVRRTKPIIFLELHKRKFIERFGVTRRDIVRPLFEAGYQAFLIQDHHDRKAAIVPISLDEPDIVRENTDMFIFWHPDRTMRST